MTHVQRPDEQLQLAILAHLNSLDGSELSNLKVKWLEVNRAIWHTQLAIDKLRPCWLWNVREYESLIGERAHLKIMLHWLDEQINYLRRKSR